MAMSARRNPTDSAWPYKMAVEISGGNAPSRCNASRPGAESLHILPHCCRWTIRQYQSTYWRSGYMLLCVGLSMCQRGEGWKHAGTTRTAAEQLMGEYLGSGRSRLPEDSPACKEQTTRHQCCCKPSLPATVLVACESAGAGGSFPEPFQ